MFGKISAFTLFAALVAAVHEPVGDPQGNPITSPLNEIVPAGEPFTIKWTPTSPNTVSLVLLKGQSCCAEQLEVIVEGIANSGSYVWTPGTDLEPTTNATGYGIQLIDDVTGFYQYSTQIGISNDDPTEPSSSASVTYGTGYSTIAPVSTKTPSYNATSVGTTSYYTASTGFPKNSTIVYPTKSLTVPSSLLTTATPTGGEETTPPASATSTPPASTGAASKLGAGLVGVLAAAAFAL